MLSNLDAKKYFELHLGSTISDSAWYRLKKVLRDCGMVLTLENLQTVARLKLEKQYTKLSLKQLIECHVQAHKLATQKVVIKGDVVFNELQKRTKNKAHRTTIIRWFQSSVPKINGKYFDKERNYKAEELVKVFASALMYEAKYSSIKLEKGKS
ncbi:hypothetical protein NIES4071_109320 (plasmid) [Calothrix sp. NIES-4071]|nr:hypothetical protein NIES4071_109320 [Calothrix sp. NIES-4071]BAZ65195.1 hypothetical protein NIES4105_109280 [Calothrix sp. NIES-4105]